jgi:uncharacterized protein
VNAAVRPRYESLDAIRGVAVMGILTMNIVHFAYPHSAYRNPLAGGPAGAADITVWFFNYVLFDTKMYGLFSVLFGASTLLVIERAVAAGRGAMDAHYSRMVWLAVFGLLHYFLVWDGDILLHYAVCGLLLFLFRKCSVRALLLWSIVFFLACITITLQDWRGLSNAVATGAIPAKFMRPESPWYAEEVAAYLGNYASIFTERASGFFFKLTFQTEMFLCQTMGLMLLGMALFKSGMLTGGWSAARYRKWAIACFLIGLPVLIGLAIYPVHSGFNRLAVVSARWPMPIPFNAVLTVGWTALIMLLLCTVANGAVRARLAAAGRMAFTNYLMTSIVMTTIFYGYGLGLFGSVPRWALYFFCFGMWAAMLSWSKPWLDRYHYGPFEWLWRSLARRQLQPMRRNLAARPA